MIPNEVISEILEISDFAVAILKKWLKLVVSPIFFRGGWGPPLARGLKPLTCIGCHIGFIFIMSDRV